MQLQLAKPSVSSPWKLSGLEKALADLKKQRSRDHAINEIFREEVIGTNPKISLLTMFNKFKAEKIIPQFINFLNITTVPKSRLLTELENKRGIFRTVS